MSLIELKLEALKSLDFGRPAVAFEQGLRDAARDCIDRPADKRPRKVTFEFVLTPMQEEDGDCNHAEGHFRVKTILPHRQTKPYSFGLKKQGTLFFSENSPQNVDQLAFEDVDEDTGKAER
jgi:hypothetical protein